MGKINEGKQPLYQEDTNKRILNSLELLKALDEDAAATKRLHHPQAEMIEQEWVLCILRAVPAVTWPVPENMLIQEGRKGLVHHHCVSQLNQQQGKIKFKIIH